jgi:hypothetical protein
MLYDILCVFLGLECQPSDDRSGDEDFSQGGRSPPTIVAVGAAVVVMEVEGDMEVPPHLEGHQDFKEDLTEGVAFEDTGHHLEDTTEL